VARALRPLRTHTIQTLFFSRNDGLSIDTLIEPISHQQPELWVMLHLPFLLLLSPWIAKIKTETVALSERPTKASRTPGLPLTSPQESMRQPNTLECHVVGEYLSRPLLPDLQKLNTKNWILPFTYSFRCLGESLSQTSDWSPLLMMASLLEATSLAVPWIVWSNNWWDNGERYEMLWWGIATVTWSSWLWTVYWFTRSGGKDECSKDIGLSIE
jgi:hypothetical protein